MSRYCKAMYCRHSSTHTTKGHRCGNCGSYGHGDFECRNVSLKDKLLAFHQETLPINLQCTIPNCENKEYHTNTAHHCLNCASRSPHTASNCPISQNTNTQTLQKIYNITCPLCRQYSVIIKPRKIHGLTDLCCICQDNNVAILFDCDHCCVCATCLEKM
jgi:hypothetical protein